MTRCWGFAAVRFSGGARCGAPVSLMFGCGSLGGLNSPLPLRFVFRKRSAVCTLAPGNGRTVMLVLTWCCCHLVPVVFCSITLLLVLLWHFPWASALVLLSARAGCFPQHHTLAGAASALAFGIRTCAGLWFKPLAQSSHSGERLNVAGAGRAPAKYGGGHGCCNVKCTSR